MSKVDTILPADSVEFCPHPEAQDVLAIGTYMLEQPRSSDGVSPATSSQQTARKGTCTLLRVNQTNEPPQELHKFDAPAVLDMKWCSARQPRSSVLAIATSDGSVSLHQWDTDEAHMSPLQTIRCASPDVLCLSIDWSSRCSPTAEPQFLAASLSDGTLSVCQSSSTGELVIKDSWTAHEHEPWIVAWDNWNSNVLFSGGDDLKLKIWDVRQAHSKPVMVNKRFEAGVTSIQSHPHVEYLLAVGSYDDTVRLFDTRSPLNPLTQLNVGGGAWRVKWHPSPARTWDLLVACMYDGCKIVRFAPRPSVAAPSDSPHGFPSFDAAEVVQRFDLHSSIVYGADWSFSADAGLDDTLIATCSFYDHQLRLWRG